MARYRRCMRRRRWAESRAGDLFDALLALTLAATAQYEIWVGPSSTTAFLVRGSRMPFCCF